MGGVHCCCTAKEDPGGTAVFIRPPVGASEKLLLGRYRSSLSSRDVLGEGTFCVCYRAVDTVENNFVAVKVYKSGAEEMAVPRFRRQVKVLLELQKPLSKPSDASLWHEHLQKVDPCDLFIRLLDYSKTVEGHAGPTPDGELYVVTELAVESLRDYLTRRSLAKRPLPIEAVRSVAKTLVLVAAALHAKGLVHLDLKPENIMLVGESIKLIDVDGCIESGFRLEWQTLVPSSLSFSLCYSAPEWARFLTKSSPGIDIQPSLDVWSIGMTICELVTFKVALEEDFQNLQAKGQQWAAWQIPRWLGKLEKAPVPEAIRDFDPQLYALLSEWILPPDASQRRTLAQCLGHPYFTLKGSEVGMSPRLPAPETTARFDSPRIDSPIGGGSSSIRRRVSFVTVSGDLLPFGPVGEGDTPCDEGSDEDSVSSEDGNGEQLVAVFDLDDSSLSGSLTREPRKSWQRRSSLRSIEHPQDKDDGRVDENPVRKKVRLKSTAAWVASGQR